MTPLYSHLLTLGIAVILDLILGEPPTAIHPVAWMGSAISFVRKRAPKNGRLWPFMAGLLLMLVVGLLLAVVTVLITRATEMLPQPIQIVVQAMLLKTTFSVRGLLHAGQQVQSVLAAGNLLEARRRLSWHLVSRDTSNLNESQIAAAAIESLAENTSDSIVAPLMFYAIAGLPGAFVYRFINTCDAMLGYRDAEREWLGKFPARLDDLANLIPARITAVMLIAAGTLMMHNPARAIWIWWRDRGLTSSPNAGHPMSAVAGVLCVELEKIGQYRLGTGFRLPDDHDISRTCRLLVTSTALACVSLAGLMLVVNGVQ